MKICFVSFEYPPMTIGGVGTYAEQVVGGFDGDEVDVHVIARGYEASHDEKIHRIFVPDVLYWRRLLFTKYAIDLFFRLDRLHKFDLVHLNGTYPITKRLRLPTVCTLHAPPNLKQMRMIIQLRKFESVSDITYLLLKNPVGVFCDFVTTAASDKIICPSPSLAEDFLSCLGCFATSEKIEIIPNGIDLRALDNAKSSGIRLLNDRGIEKDSFLLYMGRLSFVKGVDYLIEAFKRVKKRRKDLKLVIVGKGDAEPYLKEIARGVRGIVFFGYVESLSVKKLLFENSIAVVLPSPIYEVSPMVILEAMGCSKPVIATNVGGNPYLIKHGENGFLSKPKDTENLADLIDNICEASGLRNEMGRRGRKIVEENFTSEQMIARTMGTYKSLLS